MDIANSLTLVATSGVLAVGRLFGSGDGTQMPVAKPPTGPPLNGEADNLPFSGLDLPVLGTGNPANPRSYFPEAYYPESSSNSASKSVAKPNVLSTNREMLPIEPRSRRPFKAEDLEWVVQPTVPDNLGTIYTKNDHFLSYGTATIGGKFCTNTYD